MRSRGFASAQEYARQVDVDDLLPLLQRHLGHDLAIPELDEQMRRA